MRTRDVTDESGSVALLFAAITPVFVLCAALAVDMGTFYLQKRALQGATDLAAIAAAQNPNQSLSAAQQNLALNGFQTGTVQSVQSGVYSPNVNTPSSQWFTGQVGGSAVQVTTKIEAPYYFATIFNLLGPSSTSRNGAIITATSVAAVNPQAAFAVGSGLASLNGGVLNAVLGGLLGSNVSLSLADYQSLASANVDLFAFSNALASRINVTGVTYNQLANMQVSVPTVLSALADAAGASSGVSTSVVDRIKSLATLAPNTNIEIGQIISFGASGSVKINSPEPITATADALDMVSAIAQLANGQHQVQLSLGLNASPIASATLALAMGERPIGSGFVTIGSNGATAHTAQTRLLLTFQILQSGSSTTINLPIYMEIGSATATLTGASCPAGATSQGSATLSVTPSVVNAWIGNVSSADMSNFSSEPSPSAATLVNVFGLGGVTGRANAGISNLSPTSVAFSAQDVAGDVRKTTSTNDFVSSLLSNLFGNLQLGVSVGGVSAPVPASLSSTIGTTLVNATSPVDQVISETLDTLGLGLGNAYTWVSGVKCGSARVVM